MWLFYGYLMGVVMLCLFKGCGVMVSVFTSSVVDCGLISTVHRWCNG